MKKIKLFIPILFIPLLFTGCIVGDVVALPFRVTGAVVNVVTPDVVGDTISGTGDVIDTAIPF